MKRVNNYARNVSRAGARLLVAIIIALIVAYTFSCARTAYAGCVDTKSSVVVIGAKYKVTHDYLRVRAKASTEAKCIGELHRGDVVTVTSRVGDWMKVNYKGGRAWVKRKWAYETYLKNCGKGFVWYSNENTWVYKNPGHRDIKSNVVYHMTDKVWQTKSETGALIYVNRKSRYLICWLGSAGNWTPRIYTKVLTGCDWSRTPLGVHKIIRKLAYFSKSGYRYCKAMNFSGNSWLHTEGYDPYEKSYVWINPNGYTHGCVSVPHKIEGWMYSICKVGTKVIVCE